MIVLLTVPLALVGGVVGLVVAFLVYVNIVVARIGTTELAATMAVANSLE